MNHFKKILLRLFKESHCIHVATRGISYNNIMNKMELFPSNGMYFFNLKSLFIHNRYFQDYLATEQGRNLEKKFALLMLENASFFIDDFILNKKLNDIFEKELNNNLIRKYNQTINISEYKNILFKNNINPWQFFSDAFSWRLSPQGFDFWENINTTYRQELINLLLKTNY